MKGGDCRWQGEKPGKAGGARDCRANGCRKGGD